MSLTKKKQALVNKTAQEAAKRVMSFELASKKLSGGLGAQIERTEATRVLDLMGGEFIGVYLLKRYRIQIWAVYTIGVSLGLLVVWLNK